MATAIKVFLATTPVTSEALIVSEDPASASVNAHGDLMILDNDDRAVAGYAAGQWLTFKSDGVSVAAQSS